MLAEIEGREMKHAVAILLLNSGSIVCGATFFVFLALKMLEKITWSWWWITAPLWTSFVLVNVIIIMLALTESGRDKK